MRVGRGEQRTGTEIAVGVGRLLWGMTLATVPGRVHHLGSVDYPGADGGVWVRAFGVRTVVFALGALHPDPAVRTATMRSGIVMDAVDMGMVLLARRSGLPGPAAAVGATMAGAAMAVALMGEAVRG